MIFKKLKDIYLLNKDINIISINDLDVSHFKEIDYSEYFKLNISKVITRTIKITYGKSVYITKYKFLVTSIIDNTMLKFLKDEKYICLEINISKLSPNLIEYAGSEKFLGEYIINSKNSSLQNIFYNIITKADNDLNLILSNYRDCSIEFF